MPRPEYQELSRAEEETFSLLPLFIKDKLVCKCVDQRKRRVYENNKRLSQIIPDWDYTDKDGWANRAYFSFWCTLCWLPTKKTVDRVVEECDECEKYYVPRVYPVRYKLCGDCGGDATTGPPTNTAHSQRA